MPVTRGTPAGIKLDDGFSTKIALTSNPTISFWEVVVKPPGFDGGEPIDTTTMHNTLYRTRDARHLITLDMSSCKAAYDPNVYNDIIAAINANQLITVRFPDGSTLDFWGFLQKFEPDDLEEGKMPQAAITIVPTNQNNSKVEVAPVLTSVAGT